ncbi:MAG: acetylornithine deacetylase [Pseudomonadota bacterium]
MAVNTKAFIKQGLSELVAIPSVSSINDIDDMSNIGVVDLLADKFEGAGFRIETMLLDSAREKKNLIARVGDGEGGLVLSGHTDTVPYNAELWDSDPFVIDERDNRWYGLGAADMKCFFPIIEAAIAKIDLNGLSAPLTIVATADEESTMNGARLFERKLGDFAVIGEPTSLNPIALHKGIMVGQITIVGRSGHSSMPHLGLNAIDVMHQLINELKIWREALPQRFDNDAFELPIPTMNFGRIEGGDSPNRICASCALSFDVRLLPGMNIADIEAELRDLVDQIIASSGASGGLEMVIPPIAGMQTSEVSPVVRAACDLTGRAAKSVAFATEGGFFNALGMQTVVCGAGAIEVAHQPNEYVPVADAIKMVAVVEGLIHRFCT